VIKTEFVGTPSKWEIYGFLNKSEYYEWLRFQHLANPNYYLDIEYLFGAEQVYSE
jgi:hypothetical protein